MKNNNIPVKKTTTGRGMLFNEDNQLLIVSEDKANWHLPGGWVDERELLPTTCKREIFEETGINAEIEKGIFIEETIAYDEMVKGGLLHRLDIFFICKAKDCTLDESFVDVDNGLIKGRKFITEDEFKKDNVLAPKELKKLNFEQIKSLPNCYGKLVRVTSKEASFIK